MMLHEYIRFIKRCWPLLLFGTITVFWGNFGQSFFVSWYGTSFQESLGLSATSYGSAYSVATLASGLLLMWVGAAIDKVSLRWFILFCGLGLFTATFVLWKTTSLWGLIAGLFMLRFFGQGLLPHTAVTTITRDFSTHRGKAISVASSGVPIGEILLPSLAVFLIAVFGWQKSWLVVGLSVPLIYLPLAFWLLTLSREKKYDEDSCAVSRNPTPKLSQAGSRRTLLKDLRFWLVLPTILAAPFIITGIFIHQGFLLPEMGWTTGLFASCFIFYGSAHWLSSLYTGALVDRFSAVRILRFFPLPMLLGLLITTLASGNWVAYTLMILLGSSIGSSSPIINGLWAEVYGTKHLGAIRALISSLAVISTSVSPVFFGLLIDRGISGKSLFTWLTLYVLVAFVLSLFSFSEKKI